MHPGSLSRWIAFGLGMAVAPGLLAQAQQSVPGAGARPQDEAQEAALAESDLDFGLLDELLATEVTTLLGAETDRSRIPAALTILSPEQLARAGVLELPDALRLVPGFQVAQVGRRTYAVASRGLVDQFSNRLLVLQDGRSAYTPTFGGVWWDTLGPMLDDLSRIEVIRGPGALYWGANAVNGVVNIVSKKASETQGLLLRTAWSTANGVPTVGLRYGGRAGPETHWRLWGRYEDRNGFELADGGASFDDMQAWRGGLRIDHALGDSDELTFIAEAYRQRFSSTTRVVSALRPGQQVTQLRASPGGGHVIARWNRDTDAGGDFELQVLYDGSTRDESGADETRDTLEARLRWTEPLGERWTLTTGGSARWDRHRTFGSQLTFDPANAVDWLFGAFAEATYAAIPDELGLTAGLRLEHNDFSGLEVQANLRAAWQAAEDHFFWTSLARVTRTPNRTDGEVFLPFSTVPGPVGLSVIGIAPNPNLESENSLTVDLGWRWTPREGTEFNLSAFFVDTRDLLGPDFANSRPVLFALSDGTLPGLGTPFANITSGRRFGFETDLRTPLSDDLDLSLWYALSIPDFRPAAEGRYEDGTQQQRVQGTLTWRPAPEWETTAVVGWTDRLRSAQADAYWRVDAQIAWRASEELTVRVGGQNLTDARHLEGGATALVAQEVERVFYAVVELRF